MDFKNLVLGAIGGAVTATLIVTVANARTENNRITHPEMTDEEYVIFCYSMFLHRDPDQGGFDYWVAQLKSGNISRTSFYLEFLKTTEFLPPFI